MSEKSQYCLNRCRKTIWENSASIYDKKSLNKVGIEGTYLSVTKAKCDKATASIILSTEKWKLFL